jgi:hypothetical protein
MSNNPLYNLTDQKISFTYQNILQTDGFGNYYNGLGDQIYISGGSGGGAPGPTGPAGATGPAGSAGATGATGPAGAGEFYYQSTVPSPDPASIGARWMDSDTGIEYVWVYDGVNYLWMQPAQIVNTRYVTTYIGTSTYSTSFTYNYYGVIYSSGVCNVMLPLGNSPADDGKNITITDEVGGISSYNRGIIVGATGGQTINGNSSITMKINRMSLTFIFRNNSWKII